MLTLRGAGRLAARRCSIGRSTHVPANQPCRAKPLTCTPRPAAFRAAFYAHVKIDTSARRLGGLAGCSLCAACASLDFRLRRWPHRVLQQAAPRATRTVDPHERPESGGQPSRAGSRVVARAPTAVSRLPCGGAGHAACRTACYTHTLDRSERPTPGGKPSWPGGLALWLVRAALVGRRLPRGGVSLRWPERRRIASWQGSAHDERRLTAYVVLRAHDGLSYGRCVHAQHAVARRLAASQEVRQVSWPTLLPLDAVLAARDGRFERERHTRTARRSAMNMVPYRAQ